MKQKYVFIAVLLALTFLLTACGAGNEAERKTECPVNEGDTVERFAEANPGSGESINVPGYENLTLQAGSKSQKVYLFNPENNAAYFIMTLTLDSGETLWKGKALYPGEAFTGITLKKSLNAGKYAATLRYSCFLVSNNEPLNGAEVQLNLIVN